jgi:3-methylcrotonyl-CoA carboxylase alpha subunit
MLWNQHDDLEARRQDIAQERYSPWSVQDAFGLSGPRRQELTVLVDGVATKVEVSWGSAGPVVSVAGQEAGAAAEPRSLRIIGEANPLYVICDMAQVELRWPTFEAGAIDEAGDGGSVRAPIIGRVAKIFVKEGDTVAKGDRIAVVEAMKMEHVLHAGRDGKIEKLAAKEGEQVSEGALIAQLADA